MGRLATLDPKMYLEERTEKGLFMVQAAMERRPMELRTLIWELLSSSWRRGTPGKSGASGKGKVSY